MKFHDYAARIVSTQIPYTARCPSCPGAGASAMHMYNDYGFDLQTLLASGIGAVNNLFNPPATVPIGGGPAGTPKPIVVQTASPALFSVGGFAITPAKLAVGLAALGAVIFFARRKKRG